MGSSRYVKCINDVLENLIITGLHTHMCVRYTTADAFCWNCSINIPKDATEAFTEEDYQSGLKYLKDVYGAKITSVDEIIKDYKG